MDIVEISPKMAKISPYLKTFVGITLYLGSIRFLQVLGRKPPTDPTFSDSRGGDPPLTITGIESAGSQAKSDEFSGWVKS